MNRFKALHKGMGEKENAGDFKCTTPDFVIPHGLNTLYRYSLTTMAQDKPYHEKPLLRDCCNHKGSCTLFRSYLTIAARISSSSFVQVSTRQLTVSSCPREFQAHSILTRALVLTGLELATSRTQSECRIDWANLTETTTGLC